LLAAVQSGGTGVVLTRFMLTVTKKVVGVFVRFRAPLHSLHMRSWMECIRSVTGKRTARVGFNHSVANIIAATAFTGSA
jgi:hypothetical protein